MNNQERTLAAIEAIQQITDYDSLKAVQLALAARRDLLGKLVGTLIRLGMRVEFDAGKGRGIQRGTVIKVNPKKCVIDVQGRSWTVPHEMLRVQDTDPTPRIGQG